MAERGLTIIGHEPADDFIVAGQQSLEPLAAGGRQAAPGEAPVGTVTMGSRADLVMTDANPLQGLKTLERPAGVMANGSWYDAAELQSLLDGVAAKYSAVAQSR